MAMDTCNNILSMCWTCSLRLPVMTCHSYEEGTVRVMCVCFPKQM